MYVSDALVCQRLLQHLSGELRIPPGFGDGSDVAHKFDFEALQNRNEFVKRPRRMAYGVNSSHSQEPRTYPTNNVERDLQHLRHSIRGNGSSSSALHHL